MVLVQLTQPASEPITRDEAKAQAWIDSTDSDDLVDAYISSARDHCEEYLNRVIVPRQFRASFQNWPMTYGITGAPIILPMIDINSIDEVRWTDPLGTDHVLVAGTDYLVSLDHAPARIYPPLNQGWVLSGSGSYPFNQIKIKFTSGIATGGDLTRVPNSILQAVRLATAHFYDSRALYTDTRMSLLPIGITDLLDPHRYRNLGSL